MFVRPAPNSREMGDHLLDAVATELFGPVERGVGFLEYLIRRGDPGRVQERETGAERDHSERIARVRHGEAFDSCSHALDRAGCRGEGLFGKDAQELVATEAVERVSGADFLLEPARERMEDPVAGGMAIREIQEA